MRWATGMAQFNLFQLHKSVGITVLVLSLLRLAWRLSHRAPPLPTTMRAWERGLAHATHVALYVIMISMPITGWIVVSTSSLNIPTLLFHTIPWPHFPLVHALSAPAKLAVNGAFDWSHVILAWGAILLIALHVAGALKHALVERDGVAWRMLPLPIFRARAKGQ
jgi:cytochrome b561